MIVLVSVVGIGVGVCGGDGDEHKEKIESMVLLPPAKIS